MTYKVAMTVEIDEQDLADIVKYKQVDKYNTRFGIREKVIEYLMEDYGGWPTRPDELDGIVNVIYRTIHDKEN